MKAMLTVLVLMVLLVSCEPYEPVVQKGAYPVEGETEKEHQPGTPLQQISAYADGVDYVLYFASENADFKPLYRGSGKYTANIEIPDITPLDLWLVTEPASQDSVWLEVGCIKVATVNRVRMVMKISGD
jgi:hypothetical protein